MNQMIPVQPARPVRLAGGLAHTGVWWLTGVLMGSSILIFIDPVSILITLGAAAGPVMALHGPSGLVRMLRSTVTSATREDLEQATTSWLMVGGFSVLGGTIGTLIGLVQMLQQMDDPNAIGPAIAVALLTQLYGIGTLFTALVAAFSCARRVSGAALGGLTAVSTPAVALLSLGLTPLVLVPFFVLAMVL